MSRWADRTRRVSPGDGSTYSISILETLNYLTVKTKIQLMNEWHV